MLPHLRSPPATVPTQPDPIDEGAYQAISLLGEERVLRCWAIAHGFVVLTNLRCLSVLRPELLLWKGDWTLGPELPFYNLAVPTVVAGRYVSLREETPVSGTTLRFAARHPENVRAEIEAAIAPGRRDWEALRRQPRVSASTRVQPGPGGSTVYVEEVVRTIVKVPCRYCGALIESTVSRCPLCGAPQR